jgi:hypothetical protein
MRRYINIRRSDLSFHDDITVVMKT